MFTLVPARPYVPGGIPLPSRSSARLAALTVAAVCSAASTVALTSPAQADGLRIHDVQGTTRTSPYAGQKVTDVPGIVTGTRTYGSSRGFWIQDPTPDDNPGTSEGVFVFTSSTPKVSVGDSVTVTESPTATFGVELVKTKTPSLVAGLSSGVGSCSQNPLEEP